MTGLTNKKVMPNQEDEKIAWAREMVAETLERLDPKCKASSYQLVVHQYRVRGEASES